jgi:hypothetical protein
MVLHEMLHECNDPLKQSLGISGPRIYGLSMARAFHLSSSRRETVERLAALARSKGSGGEA